MEKDDFYTILKRLESERNFEERRKLVKMLPKYSDTFSKVKTAISLSFKILLAGKVATKKKEFEKEILKDEITLSTSKYLSIVFGFFVALLISLYSIYKIFF